MIIILHQFVFVSAVRKKHIPLSYDGKYQYLYFAVVEFALRRNFITRSRYGYISMCTARSEY